VHEAVYGVAFLVGPALGGVLIGLVGPLAALWATAIGFALAVGLTLLIRIEGAGPPPAHERPRSIWHGTVEGVVYVWRDPLLRALAALDCVLIAAYLPFESVLLPVHFNQIDAPSQLGLVVTAMSGGTIIGSLAYPMLVRRVRRRQLFVWSVFSTCGTLLGLAAYPGFVLMVVLGVLVGLCWGPVSPIVNLAMQVRTPEQLRGRVIGVLTSVAYAAGPLGLLVAGPLVDAIGVRPASLAFAGLLLAAALACFGVSALHQLDALVEPTHTTPLHLADSTRPDAVRIAGDEPPDDPDPASTEETT
ncbi:MAG: MFS transporter, partial [Nocardioidaceae bacterium]